MSAGPDRRTELLDRIVDHVVDHGIDGLTLRGLSEATGSNNRMLLYYFHSRDEIIVAALQAATYRFPRITGVPEIMGDITIPVCDRLDAAWRAIASPENLPFHRLFFQVFGLASFKAHSYEELLGRVGEQWLHPLSASILHDGHLDEIESMRRAGQVISLWRGLQMALLTGVEPAAIDRTAFDAHARLCRVD